jgi:hypothetical protein
MFIPSTRIVPFVGSNKPIIISTKVLFPAPLVPIMPIESPGCILIFNSLIDSLV